MDRRKTGLTARFTTLCLAAAMIAAVGISDPVFAQTTLFQDPELTVATAEGNVGWVRDLLAHKTNVNRKNKEGRTALIIAATGGQVEITEMLLDAGARTDIADKSGNGPLSWAASQGESDIVSLLLEAGADIDSQNRQGLTPLMLAASNGHLRAVRMLLDAGADVTIFDYTGRGLLGWARDGRNPQIEQLLERAGATD